MRNKQSISILNLDSILQTLSAKKSLLKKKYGVIKIGIFGSYATGSATTKSDIDIVIELNSSNTFQSFFGVKKFLESHFHRKIDLGIESSLKPSVKASIQSSIRYV